MADLYPLLKPLTEQLMKEVIKYGILAVSTEQYQNVCNSITKFAAATGIDSYSPELMTSYQEFLDQRVSKREICKEYRRFKGNGLFRMENFIRVFNIRFKRFVGNGSRFRRRIYRNAYDI